MVPKHWYWMMFLSKPQAFCREWCYPGRTWHRSQVTNVGCFGRFGLLGSATIVEMFLLPRMVRDAVSLLHPDKTTQPFMAFGGKLYGPRAFILGFPNKDQLHPFGFGFKWTWGGWRVEHGWTLESLEMDQSCGDGMRILPETLRKCTPPKAWMASCRKCQCSWQMSLWPVAFVGPWAHELVSSTFPCRQIVTGWWFVICCFMSTYVKFSYHLFPTLHGRMIPRAPECPRYPSDF